MKTICAIVSFDPDEPLAYYSFLEAGDRGLISYAQRVLGTTGPGFAGLRKKAEALRVRLHLRAAELTYSALIKPAVEQIAEIEDARIRAAMEKSVNER